MGEARARVDVVYVLSAGHSGSTLLSLLLNAHSRMHALSEIDKLGRFTRDPERGHRPLRSAFWQEVRARYEAERGRPFAQIDLAHPTGGRAGDALREWADDYETLARVVSEVAGKPLLIDASKDLGPLASLLRSGRFRVRVLALSRDGRGVVHSYLKKGLGTASALRAWSLSVRAARRMRAECAAEDWLDIRYEDLCRDPESELRRTCAFLGVPYETAMLSFREAPWEGVAGNRVARSSGSEISLDESWRTGLGLPHRLLLALLGAGRALRGEP